MAASVGRVVRKSTQGCGGDRRDVVEAGLYFGDS